MSDFNKKVIPAAAILGISIVMAVVLRGIQRQNASLDVINGLTFHLTENYQCRQIAATISMFLFGMILSLCLFQGMNFVFIFSISYPFAISLWCILLYIYLILGIPCKIILIIPPLAVGLLILCIRRNYELKLAVRNGNLITAILIASSFVIIASTGVFPGLVTGDSYYFVFQFGEIIAETGKMSFDSAGAYMTWAGAMPALMSTFSALFGYETILVTHYMLVVSMILLIGYEWYMSFLRGRLKREKAILMTVFCCTVLLLISPMEIILPYQISNTYTMVYLVMFLLIGELYWAGKSDSGKINAIDVVMCFSGIWLTLSRPEGFVLFAFLFMMLSYIQINQKKIIFVCVPSVILEMVYLLKVLIEQKYSTQSVLASRFSPMVVSVIVIVIIVVVAYSIFYENKFIVQIKAFLPIIVIGLLPLLSVAYGLLFDRNILRADIDAIFSNFNKELWGGAPHIAILAGFGILFSKRRFNLFRWMVIIGYIFLNFAFNLARNEILLKNFGDSYNRILLSIMPYIVFCLTDWVINELKRKNV